MHRRRTHRLGVAAAAASAGLALALLPASPASAITVLDWPASRVPVGCPVTGAASTPAGFNLQYTDTTPVSITGWSMNGSTRRVVLKPGTNTTRIRLTASQLCSGVEGVLPLVRISTDGGPVATPSGLSLTPVSSNAFNAVFGLDGSSSSTNTGWLEIPVVGTAQRYDTLVLDQDFALVSKVDYSGGITYATGPWSKQRVYIVLATTQTTSASRTSVARGGTVAFTTTLKKAGSAAYVALPAVAVKFQTKLPGKAWVTRATRTTSATGKASFSFKPSATMAWRWVRAENVATAPYTAASTSAIKTIKVT